MSKQDPTRKIGAKAAAARLSIAVDDLPRLDHPWTNGDVWQLRRDRPEWLTVARRHFAEEAGQAKAKAIQDAEDALIDAGFTEQPDDEKDSRTFLIVDEARAFLMSRGFSESVADDAVEQNWPSMSGW